MKSHKKKTNLTDEDKAAARMSLGDILGDDFPDEIILSDNESAVMPSPNASSSTNYDTLRENVNRKAKHTLNSLLRFYLTEEIIEQEEYVRAKMALEKSALANLIYLMETSEKAITTLLRTIDSGEMHPRMFEVLGGLQKTLLDIIKSQTIYMIAAEESVKKLSRDIDVYRPNASAEIGSKTSSGGSVSARGTKDLMKTIMEINAADEKKEEADLPENDPDHPDFDPGFDAETEDVIPDEEDPIIEDYDEDENELEDEDDQ